MIKKFPIIRPSIGFSDIWRSLFIGRNYSENYFAAVLADVTGKKHVFLVNSGLTGFYLALLALKKYSQRQEVVLPAYTAGSLVVAVCKAGLKPVLCDIRLDDFNAGPEGLLSAVSSRTLAVVAVHMFGIPLKDIPGLKVRLPSGVCLIEDCAQAEGSKVDNLAVGSFGEFSLFSFNRGKNFSTFGGGGMVTNDRALAKSLEDLLVEIKSRAGFPEFFLAMKMGVAILATNPYVYGVVNSLLSRFKENSPPNDFIIARLSGFQFRLGAVLAKDREKVFSQRHQIGEYLKNGLKTVAGVRSAEISSNCYPVYNRLPVLFEDLKNLKKKERELLKAGFEVSRMYVQPLHQMFALGYKPEDFPNANYFSQHLLTLPVYPGLGEKQLEIIIEVIKR